LLGSQVGSLVSVKKGHEEGKRTESKGGDGLKTGIIFTECENCADHIRENLESEYLQGNPQGG